MNELQAISVGKSSSHLLEYQGVLIHKDAVNAVECLQQEAQKSGFELTIASGFRDFDRQLAIWNAKFRGLRPVFDDNGQVVNMDACSDEEKIHAIMLFSALPGASRHHFGCDFDLYAKNLTTPDCPLQLTPEEYLTGPQAPFNHWLNKVLCSAPFYRPYEEYQGGIAQEPWHVSYYPVADELVKYQTMDAIALALRESNIAGKDTILNLLPRLYERYITNVCVR